MKFPYVEFLGLAEDRVFRPMIPVTFKDKSISFETYCLIDSGADYTILPIEVANRFNVKLNAHTSYRVQDASGDGFKIYKSPIDLEQIVKQRGFRDIRSKSTVYFAESGGTFLLGQNNFLNQLSVELNGKGRYIEIHN